MKLFVDSLNQFVMEAKRIEHCQDLNDFYETVATATEQVLNQFVVSASEPNDRIEWLENELRALLTVQLPLAASGTPACTDCCMCRALERITRVWLADSFEPRAECPRIPK